MKHVQDLCEQSQDNLSSVLSSMCTLGDPEAKAIVKEIVQDVAVRKGVRKGVEELVGDETFSKYMESLRVPDWVVLDFKTKARVLGNTWQAVINITKLGRTGVRFCSSCSRCHFWKLSEGSMVLLQWLSFFVKRSLFKPLQNINGDLHARDSPLFIHCPLRIVGFGKWRGGVGGGFRSFI